MLRLFVLLYIAGLEIIKAADRRVEVLSVASKAYMVLDYQRLIVAVLSEVGDKGLPLGKIARHVYNSSCTFFERPSYEKVYSELAQYLSRQSRMSDGMVKRVGGRGVYALNADWVLLRQMVLDFDAATDAGQQEHTGDAVEDKSLMLPLFDFQ